MLKHKRGLSLIIGYILLVAISIVMSIVVYQWLKTYVPTESIECDDGTSIFISDISYNCALGTLGITVKNNGKFSVNGYFIRVSNNPAEEIATIDISSKIIAEMGGSTYGNTNSIAFSDSTCTSDCENTLTPGPPTNTRALTFGVSDYGSSLMKIELIPTRIQEIDNKKRLVSCGDAKIEETFACK